MHEHSSSYIEKKRKKKEHSRHGHDVSQPAPGRSVPDQTVGAPHPFGCGWAAPDTEKAGFLFWFGNRPDQGAPTATTAADQSSPAPPPTSHLAVPLQTWASATSLPERHSARRLQFAVRESELRSKMPTIFCQSEKAAGLFVSNMPLLFLVVC